MRARWRPGFGGAAPAAILAAGVVAACAPATPGAGAGPAPARAAVEAPGAAPPQAAAAPVPPAAAPAQAPRPRSRVAPPEVAFRLGLMPLASTGVTSWRLAHPTWDGRGVLIAILDSGVDPGIAGLTATPLGEAKVLDLRDFSGEGAVPLRPRGDGVWTGEIREIAFGDLPQADLNGDGDNTDVFAVEVARDAEGWKALVDADGDGVLASETWLRDYRARRETFTFASRLAPRGRGPVTAALNLDGPADAPRLVVYLDNSGHGSHVAGIAAGYNIYGLGGFSGVAPGAQLLGLKIADNLRGGVSATGSMLRAMEYAVAFARERGMPLVLNMSFGVGNAEPGRAVMDSIINAFLLAHPDVFFALSAGNDGPGMETMGLPATAELAVSVGATYPASFAAVQFDADREGMGWWSARGGSSAKPDLVAPGLAYSTVPGWKTGEEIAGGTSMASPHVAGLAALLLSAARQEGRSVSAAAVLEALRASARPVPGAAAVDQGAGLPDVERAWQHLRQRPASGSAMRYRVEAMPVGYSTQPGGPAARATRAAWTSGALRPGGLATRADTIQRFRVSVVGEASAPARPRTYRLVSDAPWLRPAQPTVTIGATGSAVVEARYDAAALAVPGRHAGALRAVAEDDGAGGAAAFVLASTVLVPEAGLPFTVERRVVPAGASARWYVRVAEGAAGLVVRASVRDTAMLGTLSLFEPGGRPARGFKGGEDLGGERGRTTVLAVSAGDVVPGVWEIVVQAMPGRDLTVDVAASLPPVRLAVEPAGTVSVTGGADTVLSASLAWVGAATTFTAVIDSVVWRRAFDVPAWADTMVVEVELTNAVWNEVTDFAITLFDSAGARLGNGAMNYPTHRVLAGLEAPPRAGSRVTLDLFPGFARAVAPRVEARVRVGFQGRSRDVATLPPAREAVRRLAAPPLDGRAPAGWSDVYLLRVGAGPDDPAATTSRFVVGPQ